MKTNPNPPQRWAKPELKRLGKLKDVKGSTGVINDGSSINPRPS